MATAHITLTRHGQGLQWVEIEITNLTITQAGPTHGGSFIGRKVAALPKPGERITFCDTSFLRWPVATVTVPAPHQ